jgi:uncharacterized protein
MLLPPGNFQILSLDGGGIRGLFSAAVLAALEKDLCIKVEEHFDLIAGTSTGGIIALGLACGLRPAEIVEFYVQHGPSIFDNAGWKGPLRVLQRVVMTPYRPEPLELALKQVFGDRTLADCHKRLVIPATNLEESDVYLFKTPHHERLKRDWRVPLWQVARSTSAAPTYFRASTHVGNARLIDGGVWCNNPTAIAIAEAVSMLDVPLQAIKVFSLGTTTAKPRRSRFLDAGGMFFWALPVADLLMSLQVTSAHAQAMHLVGSDNIHRLNPETPVNTFTLDKVDIERLTAWASTQSRHLIPVFERMFKAHRAATYTPLYPNQEVHE